ncbi:MAG: FAD-dependent thymidylate synthase [Candidatus Abyssobacteria bacterium SURF_5]|uniref:Flavin-dependent thymidylate synthase n=1 Tax=Abyssobacteria bacterium (strain SURF_5) TaxID=2093360 RepID=A0A3A4NGM9_ABYX5|nr:MAG: FAD-dependent thymidylate synthase [Candidatus Abyssubacteria bacterium SURF_5]
MESSLKVKLLRYTPEPEKAVALSAKLCYSPVGIDKLAERIDQEETVQFLQRLTDMGHFSPLEHASFTFGIEGVSRATTHQLVRHRIASYSQQSQRYVKKKKQFDYITPPTIRKQPELRAKFERAMAGLQALYAEFLEKGTPAEDARYLLPNAAETKIIVSMNARELRLFFRQRCCTRAQWEIRHMAEEMLRLVQEVAPVLFAKCGPPCITGHCPEGEMSCGRAASFSAGEKTN